MRLLAIAFAVALLLGTAYAVCAENAPTEDDLKLAQLANLTRARELYLAGEAASKKGDLQTAIWDWAQALTLKPDSAYTAKCLADARQKVYKQYMATVSAKSDTKDPLTALVRLNVILPLVPDNKELVPRAATLEHSLTDDQRKALTAYKSGWNFATIGDYASAGESFATAQAFARGSACIEDALRQLDILKRGPSASAPQVAAPSRKLPQLIYIYATWCGYCKMMRPTIDDIASRCQGRLVVRYIDGDANPEAARRYNATGFPREIFLDSNGVEVDRINGYTDQKEAFTLYLGKLGIRYP